VERSLAKKTVSDLILRRCEAPSRRMKAPLSVHIKAYRFTAVPDIAEFSAFVLLSFFFVINSNPKVKSPK